MSWNGLGLHFVAEFYVPLSIYTLPKIFFGESLMNVFLMDRFKLLYRQVTGISLSLISFCNVVFKEYFKNFTF